MAQNSARTASMRHNEKGRSNKGTAAVQDVDRGSAFDGLASHEPDLCLTGCFVMPQDIREAIAVEITATGDVERQADERGAGIVLPIHRCSAGYAIGIHIPDLRLATRSVVPDDIGSTVHVDVVGRDDAPRQTDEGGGDAVLG